MINHNTPYTKKKCFKRPLFFAFLAHSEYFSKFDLFDLDLKVRLFYTFIFFFSLWIYNWLINSETFFVLVLNGKCNKQNITNNYMFYLHNNTWIPSYVYKNVHLDIFSTTLKVYLFKISQSNTDSSRINSGMQSLPSLWEWFYFGQASIWFAVVLFMKPTFCTIKLQTCVAK